MNIIANLKLYLEEEIAETIEFIYGRYEKLSEKNFVKPHIKAVLLSIDMKDKVFEYYTKEDMEDHNFDMGFLDSLERTLEKIKEYEEEEQNSTSLGENRPTFQRKRLQ